jgi:hypothetical protein
MIGHLQILEARKEGRRPTAIFIEAGFQPTPARYRFERQEEALDYGFYPTVTVTPEELTSRLDLRFCMGCRVHVHGHSMTDDVLDFAEKVAKAGATEVIVCGVTGDSEILTYNRGHWGAYASAA